MRQHDWNDSLRFGDRLVRWLEKNIGTLIPGATFHRSTPAQDRWAKVDGFLTLPVQIKADDAAGRTFNVFLETQSVADGMDVLVPGWIEEPGQASMFIFVIPSLSRLYLVSTQDLIAAYRRWKLVHDIKATSTHRNGRIWTTRGIVVPLNEFEQIVALAVEAPGLRGAA